MLSRVFRGAIVGLFAAAGAWALSAKAATIVALFVIAIVVAMVDVLAGEIFTLLMLFAIGAFIWAYTPVGKYIVNELPNLTKYQDNPSK